MKKTPFTLYWVETPAPEENCFVAARSSRAATIYEEDGTGFNRGDCKATAIRRLDDDWVTSYLVDEKVKTRSSPFYVQPEDVHSLGIERRIVEGDEVFEFNDQVFIAQGTMNYLASLADPPDAVVIRSVTDLLGLIKDDNQKDWIFRGHSSCFWHLEAGVHRLLKNAKPDLSSLINQERRFLNEFKRRARIFLQSSPSSDWEWMVLAQHFGLPTRMLDWTENPLVALYFAVKDRSQMSSDGVLYAYRHGSPDIDIGSTSDPFSIERIELVRPPHLDQRVIAQQSIFTAEPPLLKEGGREEANLRYWYVSVRYKTEIRTELSKLGISESALFPGLASLATEIREEFVPPKLPATPRARRRARETAKA